MSKSTEVLERIIKGEYNFDSDYRLIFWQGADYLLDVDNSKLFKEVRTDEVQGQWGSN